ncbi:NAD kinase [Spongisporangium articulatum]|uniref:NAD kinase n=1 Tax=Spongisporangium articulatum TaxID=3362603 RepID=A0ABW8ASI9_9ACTN
MVRAGGPADGRGGARRGRRAGDRGGAAVSDRRVLVLAHTGRPIAVTVAEELVGLLQSSGLEVMMPAEEAAELAPGAQSLITPSDPADVLDGAELVVVLGGDGTILRAAEITRGTGVPLLGVNLGHVGFLAESERDDLAYTAQRIAARDYEVEERMTLEVAVFKDGVQVGAAWAINEASVEKVDRERMIEVVLEVDGRPVTEFGCDGVVLATPTGSTAYSFSAGGPVVWPEVEALLLTPLSAHALFARPLVVAPTSVPAVELVPGTPGRATLWCDGRRNMDLPEGARVEVRRSDTPVRLARLARPPFTDRLVAKFRLPVHGWRGASRD